MLFSSMIFLWCFLPATLLLYWLMPGIRAKNILLLCASLVFYAWGGVDPFYFLLLPIVVAVDYAGALVLDKWKSHRRWILIAAVAVNLLILFYFKYFDFLISIINSISGTEVLELKNIILPLGISFYTFQSMSYLIDVYRKETAAQKNYFSLLLYVSMFPQLIAGPIVRYKDVAAQIVHRRLHWENLSYGAKRFLYGLGKKVLLSNNLAYYADLIFDANSMNLSAPLYWLGALFYTLQIYYDFSGYSDMAIGIGQMLGFDFLENFNFPYISKSIREFWRRWHISLSTWFKEYVYIPLGGNRRGTVRTLFNLIVVFFLTGLWHGASFAFVFWGLYHGAFMLLERAFLGKLLDKNPVKPVNHIYTIGVVMIGWVFFRIGSLAEGLNYVKQMFSFQSGGYGITDFLSLKAVIVLAAAIILAGPLHRLIPAFHRRIFAKGVTLWEGIICFAVLALCCMSLAGDAYNPFIYFRF